MRNLLKYLILSLIVLAFNKDVKGDWFIQEDIKIDYSTNVCTASLNASIAIPKTEICIPRQISIASTVRLQSHSSRHKTSHRHNHEVVRSGKAVNSIIRYGVQKYSSIIHSSLMEPANKLAILHRLII